MVSDTPSCFGDLARARDYHRLIIRPHTDPKSAHLDPQLSPIYHPPRTPIPLSYPPHYISAPTYIRTDIPPIMVPHSTPKPMKTRYFDLPPFSMPVFNGFRHPILFWRPRARAYVEYIPIQQRPRPHTRANIYPISAPYLYPSSPYPTLPTTYQHLYIHALIYYPLLVPHISTPPDPHPMI